MKLLVITATYPPLTGGISSFAYELSSALAKLGHEVSVVTRSLSFSDSVSVESSGIEVYRLRSPPIPPKDVFFYMTNFRRILKIVQKVNPDIVHDAGSAIGFMPWISRKWKVVSTIHGSPQIEEIRARGPLEDRLRSLAFRMTHSIPTRFLTTLIAPDVKAYVYVSKFCLLDTVNRVKNPKLREELLARSKVIYNGVNVTEIRKLKEDVLKRSGPDPNSIVFLGRLMEYKGVKYLLKAFHKVVEEIKDVKLHIIGDGPLYPELKDYVSKTGLVQKVKLHGSLPRREALKILARSALLVHPSFYEACPMVIMEAYAMGKPVVTHKAGYSVEMVKETEAGITVDVRNTREFSNALINLLTDNELYHRLSRNAEKVAEKLFDIRVTARKYEALYEELLKQNQV